MKVCLIASVLFAVVTPVSSEVLREEGGTWDFLLYRNGAGEPADPGGADSDFHSTWQDPLVDGYDGPVFLTGNGYFGYDFITARPVVTNVWNPGGAVEDAPPLGLRDTVYFRTVVTPTEAVTELRFSGIVDDGAIIYVNGDEVARMNVAEGVPDSYLLGTITNASETVPTEVFGAVSLAAGVPATVAVSVHNVSNTSGDLGFDLQIESVSEALVGNDAFADATVLMGDLPITVSGSNDNNVGGAGASREAGEPNHAGQADGASVWWRWTPMVSGRVGVTVASDNMDTIVAVYTGSAVDALTGVDRYTNLAIPASSIQSVEPFYVGAYAEFDAVAGTAYAIAVDGNAGSVGSFSLMVGSSVNPIDPRAVLLPSGSEWEYLLAIDEDNEPIDPETVDPNFDETWQTRAGYDGPAFSPMAPAPLGYGVLDAAPLATEIWTTPDLNGLNRPPSGLRLTTYFRTTFTPPVSVQGLGFEGLIDDGAIIYINGDEVARINVREDDDGDDWLTTADQPRVPQDIEAEDNAQYGIASDVVLAAGVPVEIAVSLHNLTSGSSDIGMDLRVFALGVALDPVDFVAILSSGADEGEIELEWPGIPGRLYQPEFSENLLNWSPLTSNPILGDVSGRNVFLHFPGTARGFYRIGVLAE